MEDLSSGNIAILIFVVIGLAVWAWISHKKKNRSKGPRGKSGGGDGLDVKHK